MADILAIVASIVSIIQITGKIVSVCAKYAAGVQSATWEPQEILEGVESLRYLLRLLESQTAAQSTAVSLVSFAEPSPFAALLCEPLERCYALMARLESKLMIRRRPEGLGSNRGRNVIRALKWPLKEPEMKKILASIDRFKATFHMALSADQTKLITANRKLLLSIHGSASGHNQHLQSVEQMGMPGNAFAVIPPEEPSSILQQIDTPIPIRRYSRVLQQDSRRNRIHHWLSAPDPFTSYDRARYGRQERTGLWLTESEVFARWKTEPKILWLHGKPGCGKTVLSSTVIDDIASWLDKTDVLAYYFFAFDDTEKSKADKMLCSLVLQLLDQRVDAPGELVSLYEACEGGLRQPDNKSLLQVLRTMCRDAGDVYMILDALDECAELEELLHAIELTQAWQQSTLHLLVTSRKEKKIEDNLKSLTRSEDRVALEGALVDADIYLFVRGRLQSDQLLRRWCNNPYVKEKITHELTRKADVMFRWVVCQLDCLQSCLLVEDVRKTLHGLPETLDATYARILGSIPDQHRQNMIRGLNWLICSLKPLRLDEFAAAIAIDPHDSNSFDHDRDTREYFDMTTICPTLVEIEDMGLDMDCHGLRNLDARFNHRSDIIEIGALNSEDSQRQQHASVSKSRHASPRIRLAHSSVKDYLISERIRQSPMASYAIRPQEAHELIGVACLTYLSTLEGIDCIDSVSLDKYPLVAYATTQWMRHAEILGEDLGQTERLGQAVLQMDQSSYKIWLRLYARYGSDGSEYLCHESIPSLLVMMCRLGFFHLARVLIESGADVNRGSINKNGEDHFNPLIAALDRRHEVDIALLLLQNGADPRASGLDTLTKAIWIWPTNSPQKLELVRLLIEKGASINMPEDSWTTPLEEASFAGELDIVTALLDHGADTSASGTRFNGSLIATALGIWNQAAALSVTKVLLQRGAAADINAISDAYGTALLAAACCPRYHSSTRHCARRRKRMLQMLIEHGADVTGVFGSKAVEAAAWQDDEEIVRLLLGRGAVFVL